VLEKTAEGILYPLWDAGLEVGHSVRSVSQCLGDCKNDFHLQVAMLDGRLITGSEKLFAKLATSYKKKFIEGRRRDFLTKMAVERENRKHLYGGHSFQLEPNIKEGRGGFRDIQSMLWSARAVFGLNGLVAIEEAGVFRPEERSALEQSFDNLVMIRNRLHYLSGRKNDQLFFEHQEGIAKALGYKDTRGVLGVEIFMQEVYGYLDTIAVATDLFFEHIDETLGAVRRVKGDVVLEKGLAVVNGRIQLTDPELLVRKPILLFKIFSQAARTGLPIHFRTRQLVSGSLGLIDDDFRSSRRAAHEFIDILGAATIPLPLLTTMLETGLLSAYLPEFGPLESLAQHDVFHVNTVDRHLLQTVEELQRLADEQSLVMSELTTPHILNLGGLLHDIGKGRGGKHDEVGAEIAGQIGKRLGLNDKDLEELQFLVRHHLYLSDIAQRRDLEDEAVIFQCAELIKDPNRLRMLYLLSIADARATGPKAWSEWKGALLQDLYLRIGHALDQSDWIDPDRQQASQWMREHVADALAGVSGDWLENLPDDYLLNYSVQEVVEHIGLKEKLTGRRALLVPTDHGDHWSVLIVSRDRTGLLSRICGTLALNNLSVLSAKIHTWPDGTVVDVVDVKPVFNNNFHEQDWLGLTTDLNLVLENRLGLAHRLAAKKTAKRSGPAVEHQRYATTVKIDNKSSRFFTLIEVFSEDQLSLLYDITRTMADFEINISKAMISTRRGQLIDVFYVLDGNGAKVTNSKNLQEIKQALTFAAVNSGS
ncbi:MAG: [protein-PII] uridylyltransferase, partial [Desulfobulbaceae bacterium]|nr:[protein-PII] uridylyltransferase [Desulfobulbaceae bacterium]